MAEEDTFGYSFRLDDGDLVLEDDPVTELRTIALISGKRNLLQALQLRVLTPFSSDRFNTTYGLDIREAFVQPGGVGMVKALIRLNLVRTLGTDPRVSDIREVLFEDDPAYFARHPELDPANLTFRHTRFWHVDVTIETVGGTSQTLAVGVGV